jgi:hypothetical protein
MTHWRLIDNCLWRLNHNLRKEVIRRGTMSLAIAGIIDDA